jgi:hypothetical protein
MLRVMQLRIFMDWFALQTVRTSDVKLCDDFVRVSASVPPKIKRIEPRLLVEGREHR